MMTDTLKKTNVSLSQKVVRGTFWVFALQIVNRGLSLARTIVLARLLAPNDFGLMGIALLALSALETFSQTGFSKALIQKKENTESYLNTAWTVQIIRGFLLAAILVLAAPLVAAFFEEPRAAMIVRVLALAELVKGLGNIGIVYFQKELEFHKQFVYRFSSTVVTLAISIPAAFILKTVWALVLGSLAGNFVSLFMSYVIHPYRPRLNIDLGKSKELFIFGRWILGSSILVFLLNQGDDIFLGKVLGVTALGLYQMAYRLSNLPATEISHVISQVSFPAYSKLQDDIEKLRKAYVQVLQVTAFISIPLAGGIFFFAPDVTILFLGEKWMPMVPAMQVLTLWGLIRALGSTTVLWQAVGKPRIVTYFQLVKLVLLATLIYPFTIWWGILGTALAVVAESLLTHLFGYLVMARTLNCNAWILYKQILFPLSGTGVMILVLSVIKSSIGVNIITLLFMIIVALIVYGLWGYLSGRLFGYNIRTTLKNRLVSI